MDKTTLRLWRDVLALALTGKIMMQATGEKDELATLGGRLRAIRRARGIKLGECARQIGVSRTSLGQWEADQVKSPDTDKLGRFVKLTEISLDWLIGRTGDDPEELSMKTPHHLSRGGRRDGAQEKPPPVTAVSEIAGSLANHAHALDLNPRAIWNIPTQVLELALNATDPSSVVISRVTVREDELGLNRGDYILIDVSRDRINEPGIFVLADPAGRAARRVLVREIDGMFKAVGGDGIEVSDLNDILGRVIGVIKAL